MGRGLLSEQPEEQLKALSAPCGGTSPKGGGKGDVGTDCRVGPLGLLAMTGLETWLPLWGSWHGVSRD